MKLTSAETEGELVNYLVRNEKQNKSYAYDTEKPGSKKAILHYRLIARSDNYSLLEVDLKTGRHHQIRCQLAKMGCHIKGDLKYGFPRGAASQVLCKTCFLKTLIFYEKKTDTPGIAALCRNVPAGAATAGVCFLPASRRIVAGTPPGG